MIPATINRLKGREQTRHAIEPSFDIGLDRVIELVAVGEEARLTGLSTVERHAYDQLVTLFVERQMWAEALLAAHRAAIWSERPTDLSQRDGELDDRLLSISQHIEGYATAGDEQDAICELGRACATAALLRLDWAAQSSPLKPRSAGGGAMSPKEGSVASAFPTQTRCDTDNRYAAFRARALSMYHAARLGLCLSANESSPMARLFELFCADELDARVIACQLSTFDSEAVRLLYGRLESAGDWPKQSLGSLLDWVCMDDDERRLLAARVLSHGRYSLIANAILIVNPTPDTDFRTWRAVLSPRVFAWAMGSRSVDPVIASFSELREASVDWTRVPLSTETVEAYQGIVQTNDQPVILAEDRPSAASTLPEARASELGRRILTLRLDALRADDDALFAIRSAVREAALLDCQIVAHLESASASDGVDLPSVLRILAAGGARVTFATATATLPLLTTYAPCARLMHVPAQSRAEQTRMWADALEALGVSESPVMENIDLLANRFLLTRDQVLRAVDETRLCPDSNFDSSSLSERLIATARRYSHDELGGTAERVATTVSWRDVVYADSTMQSLREVIGNYRHRERVLLDWGFSRKMPYGKALTAVFWGESGTGKTLAALLVARELGLELLRVDVARVFSKYIGETEKNLDRIFRLAERLHAILLFDEADSIFGKRVETKDSQSRYANLEVNYLLQRLEAFDGVAILTTNMLSNCDQAFRRRVRFAVEFPFPDADQRAELWRRLLPHAAPVSPRISFHDLGRDYELPGGHVKNAVLRAAFRAADLNQDIDEALLREAAEGECAAIGRAVRTRPSGRKSTVLR